MRNLTSQKIKRFSKNDYGEDYVVGDIHGRFDILQKLLKRVGFNEARDRLFTTGDIIDRGDFSHECTVWLDKPWFNSIRGNHEQMVIDAFQGIGDSRRHAKNGGEWYYTCTKSIQKIIAEKLYLPFAFEVPLRTGETAGIIHAEPPGWQNSITWQDSMSLLNSEDEREATQALMQALYARKKISEMNEIELNGISRVYVGHSTVDQPLLLGNTLYIDTGCSFSDGKLTIVQMNSGETLFEI